MAQKKIKGYIKLLITPGGASPNPPIGPALGQKGVNIMEFCKAFNEKTQGLDKSVQVPVNIVVYEDRSFDFDVKTPISSGLILKTVGAEKGSAQPKKDKVGKLSRTQVEEIAKIKWPDLSAVELEAAIRTIAGTARSMGVEVELAKEDK